MTRRGAPLDGADVVGLSWLPEAPQPDRPYVDTAALRDFAAVYELRTRRKARLAAMPLTDDAVIEPVALMRAAADELDRLRGEISTLRKAVKTMKATLARRTHRTADADDPQGSLDA